MRAGNAVALNAHWRTSIQNCSPRLVRVPDFRRGPTKNTCSGASSLIARVTKPSFAGLPSSCSPATSRIIRTRGYGFSGSSVRSGVSAWSTMSRSGPASRGACRRCWTRPDRAVGSLLRRPSRLLGVRFQEMPEYPDFAWREAVHNAVAHRDYAIQGAGTEIWMFEDRMEVVSAGAFPEGVTLEEVLRLERVHRSRNPRIVRVLVDLGFAKDQGEGIPRMFAEMEDAFLPRPDVKVTESQVVVTLRNTSTLTDSDRRFVAGLGEHRAKPTRVPSAPYGP